MARSTQKAVKQLYKEARQELGFKTNWEVNTYMAKASKYFRRKTGLPLDISAYCNNCWGLAGMVGNGVWARLALSLEDITDTPSETAKRFLARLAD